MFWMQTTIFFALFFGSCCFVAHWLGRQQDIILYYNFVSWWLWLHSFSSLTVSFWSVMHSIHCQRVELFCRQNKLSLHSSLVLFFVAELYVHFCGSPCMGLFSSVGWLRYRIKNAGRDADDDNDDTTQLIELLQLLLRSLYFKVNKFHSQFWSGIVVGIFILNECEKGFRVLCGVL